MLKNAYFFGKNCKNCHSVRWSALEPTFVSGNWGSASRPPRWIPAYYYNFIEFVFIANMRFNLQKWTKLTHSSVLLLLLQHFFTSNSIVFVERGRKNISCPRAQGTLATPLKKNKNILYFYILFSYHTSSVIYTV